MVTTEEIKKKLEEKRKEQDFGESDNLEDEKTGYLICKECNGYYKLQKGESPGSFDKCSCGGELIYTESLDEFFDEPIDESVEPSSDSDVAVVCPSCGKENPAKNKFCTECGQQLQD
ncbi:MAG: zinc-ribbon domain-containing protein [Methanobacterium sp.]|uniref:zinc-ribbon domain-containing protein n=1 Tax=Methanobacterium sp. TaxID=2164 RepID=UPI003D64AA51|nr:zinc-ribbon domain-containing protein [Methanobacterium sp.]